MGLYVNPPSFVLGRWQLDAEIDHCCWQLNASKWRANGNTVSNLSRINVTRKLLFSCYFLLIIFHTEGDYPDQTTVVSRAYMERASQLSSSPIPEQPYIAMAIPNTQRYVRTKIMSGSPIVIVTDSFTKPRPVYWFRRNLFLWTRRYWIYYRCVKNYVTRTNTILVASSKAFLYNSISWKRKLTVQ